MIETQNIEVQIVKLDENMNRDELKKFLKGTRLENVLSYGTTRNGSVIGVISFPGSSSLTFLHTNWYMIRINDFAMQVSSKVLRDEYGINPNS